MKRYLKRHNDESKWLEVLADPFKFVTPDEVLSFVENSKKRIAEVVSEFGGDKVGLCWSGGKDSECNYLLCDMVEPGLASLYCSADSSLEFDAAIRWRRDFAPETLEEIEVLNRQDVEREFQGFLRYDLDPATRKLHANKALQKRWKTQHGWAIKNNLQCLVFGRRTIDGNFCGKRGRYVNQNGITVLNPIYDWPHEVVIAFLVSNSRIPYIYEQPKSWNIGPRYWVASSYSHVNAVEPAILSREAEWIGQLGQWQAANGLEPAPEVLNLAWWSGPGGTNPINKPR